MQKRGDKDPDLGQTAWLEQLKRFFRSLGQRPGTTVRNDRDSMPEDFGWTETEDEYQRAQASWLEEIERRRKEPSRNGSEGL